MQTPADVIESAKPGQTVRYTLRGPASESEINETLTELQEAHPGITFILEADPEAEESHAEVVLDG